MKIQRKRYVIMRNNRSEIWCGLAQNYHFKPINDIGDTQIKSYSSEAKAESVIDRWHMRSSEIIPITETYESTS